MTKTVYIALQSVILIDSSAFSALPPIEQTEKMLEITDLLGWRKMAFTPNFKNLSDGTRIRDRLLAGEDVSLELEFNNIRLTEEIKQGLQAIRPVLQQLETLGPKYQWLPEVSLATNFNIKERCVNRNGYTISKSTLKRVWDFASSAWGSGEMPTQSIRVTADGYNREVTVTPERVSIGCQHIPRAEAEAIARALGLEPNIR